MKNAAYSAKMERSWAWGNGVSQLSSKKAYPLRAQLQKLEY